MYIATKLIYCVFIAVSLVEFSYSDQSNDGWREVRDKFGEWTTLALTTSTTPAPVSPELLCETMYNKSDNSVAIKEDIQELMSQYNNWGKLLAPAPVAIGILGQLILMANQKMDFPINSEEPQKVYKHIEYPNSFRTTLLQISQRGHRAFLKAHTNMNAISNLNRVVPRDIKDAVRYLMSKNVQIIKLRLPATLNKIKEATEKSQDLSKEVANEFELTLSLIGETELAISSTRRGAESWLEDAILDIKLKQKEKELSEKEESILKEKDVKMKAMVLQLEHRKDHIYHRTTYGNIDFTINLAKENWESEIVKEIGQEQYNKDKNFLHDKNKTAWSFTFYKRFIKSNPCAQENSQSLLDLLIAFREYRKSYEHWQKSNNQKNSVYNGTKAIENFERILGTFQQCPDIEDIKTKGFDLLKILKNITTFQSNDKTTKRPCSNEIDHIVKLVKNLRKAANEVAEESRKQEEIVINSSWDIFRISKQHQLNQFISMSKTIEDTIRLNNDLTEIRRQKTQQILERITRLNTTKMNISEVIRALKSGLAELSNLRNDWAKLIQFFENIGKFIQLASLYSTGLVEVVETLSDYPDLVSKETDLFEDLLNNVEKSNEAVLLVRGIADMYTKVSDLYIMGRVDRLNTMNSMMNGNSNDEELKQEKERLSKDSWEASKGIEDFFIQQANQLNETLKTRHQEIFAEYGQLFDCLNKTGLVDRAINFSGYYWFQLKSRFNGKVLDVSSGNNSFVQMWDSHGKDNQLWYLDQDKIIRSFATDGCLTSHGHPKMINIEPCKNTTNQKWTLKDNAIVNAVDTNSCLNIFKHSKLNGAKLDEFKCHRGANQIWDIIQRGQIVTTQSDNKPNWFQLKSRLNGKILNFACQYSPNLHMWDSHGEIHQLWYLDDDKIIRSAVNDDCITSQGYNKLVTIELCKNTKNQKWTFKDNMIVNLEDTGHCLDIFFAAKHNGAHLGEYMCHRGANQIWNIVPSGQTVSFKHKNRFQLKSRLNGKLLNFAYEYSPNLHMWDSHGEIHQLWYLDEDKIIRSVVNDDCLTSHGFYPAVVNVKPCNKTQNQNWTLMNKAIVNFENQNRCLDIYHYEKHNGARIVEYDCHRGLNQIWDIIRNGETSPFSTVKRFQLKSRMFGKIVTFLGGYIPNVHMQNPHGEMNQFWFMDQDQIIRSVVNDDCLTSQGYNTYVNLKPCNVTNNQKWTLKDNAVVNVEDPNRCLYVHYFEKDDALRILDNKCQRLDDQLWDIID